MSDTQVGFTLETPATWPPRGRDGEGGNGWRGATDNVIQSDYQSQKEPVMLKRILRKNPAGKLRTRSLSFKVTPEEIEVLNRRGAELGLNRSEYIRFVLDQAVFSDLLETKARIGRDEAIETFLIEGAGRDSDNARMIRMLDETELHRVFGAFVEAQFPALSRIEHAGKVWDVRDLNPAMKN